MAVAFGGFLWSAAQPLPAAVIDLELDSPSLDYNSYAFTPNPGSRATVQSFGAFGAENINLFDNRDSQAIFGFATDGTGGIPTGLALGDYQILSVKLVLTITHPNKVYDGTYDSIATYGPNGEPINDDAGRPMELYGVGYRNGVTSTSFAEDTPYSTSSQPAAGTRSAYATDFFQGASLSGNVRDVSNNLGGLTGVTAFDPHPFAIGQVAASDLTAGKINEDAPVTFTLDLSNPDVIRYLQLSLQQGDLYFTESSMEVAAQGGSSVFATFYSKENLAGVDPQLFIQVQIVPEPSAVTLALCGAGLFVASWRGVRRGRKPHDTYE